MESYWLQTPSYTSCFAEAWVGIKGDQIKKKSLKELLGIKTGVARELESMGYHYLEDLQKVGWEKICRSYSKQFPERLNFEIFISIYSGLNEIPKRKIPEESRQVAITLVQQIKSEKDSSPGTPKTRSSAVSKLKSQQRHKK